MIGDIQSDLQGIDGFGDPDGANLQPILYGVLPGTVLKREDPSGIGRIVARVDAFFEGGTDWLYPMTTSGGSPKRGKFDPPRLGATVRVFFPMGRTDVPGYYLAGGWGRKSDVPGDAVVDGDRTRSVEEDAQWEIVRDDRSGSGELTLRHKSSNTYIALYESGQIITNASLHKLGVNANENVLLGSSFVTYLTNPLPAAGLLAWLQGLATAAGYPVPVPTLPSPIVSSKVKVEP